MARRERIDNPGGRRVVRRDDRGRFVGDKGKATRARAMPFGNRPIALVAVVAGLIVATAGAVIATGPLRRGTTSFKK